VEQLLSAVRLALRIGAINPVAKNDLRTWFSQNGGKGWIDCKTGKPCGRKKGEKRKSYPACRPTKAQCSSAAKKKTSSKRISWKKGKK
jgi:hypothetical protein